MSFATSRLQPTAIAASVKLEGCTALRGKLAQHCRWEQNAGAVHDDQKVDGVGGASAPRGGVWVVVHGAEDERHAHDIYRHDA